MVKDITKYLLDKLDIPFQVNITDTQLIQILEEIIDCNGMELQCSYNSFDNKLLKNFDVEFRDFVTEEESMQDYVAASSSSLRECIFVGISRYLQYLDITGTKKDDPIYHKLRSILIPNIDDIIDKISYYSDSTIGTPLPDGRYKVKLEDGTNLVFDPVPAKEAVEMLKFMKEVKNETDNN